MCMGSRVTAGSLGGVMVRILAQNARDVGSFPTLGAIFPIVTTPYYTGFCGHEHVQAMLCIVVELTLCMYM